jgi:hypothetical protein
MLAPGELAIQIANTIAFIDANPSEIALIPRVKFKDGNGTRWVAGEVRPAQVFRLIDQSTARNTWPGLVQTSDGRERLTDFILLAAPDALVQVWDYWTDANGTWEVAEIFPSNQYEIRAAVVRRA